MTAPRRPSRRRALVLFLATFAAFTIVAGQMIVLGLSGARKIQTAPAESVARNVSRPDIVDRNGRLLAADLAMPSVFADPRRILDADEAAEKLAEALGLDHRALLAALSDKTRRFHWIKRGLSPAEQAKVHDLGLPGVSFRTEPRRVYPAGEDGGHVIGFVDIDNKGTAGIERWLDREGLVDTTDVTGPSERAPVRLAMDLSAQSALRSELSRAVTDFKAKAAAGVILDVTSGEVLASVSLPDFPAGDVAASLDPTRLDRISAGVFELGSVMKTMTLALAADSGVLTPGKGFDATAPLRVGKAEIDDFHPTRRVLTAEEVFLHSSNIGAALMANEAGETLMREMLGRLSLDRPMATELGKVAAPQLPPRWGKLTTMTVSYGHGIALSPLQFAAGMAALVTGRQLTPTFVVRQAAAPLAPRVVPEKVSAFLRGLLEANVTSREGTGRRAAVPGYDVGGKTGTADIPGKGGYGRNGVLSSFLAVWPMSKPRFLSYILIWDPRPSPASNGQTAAGLTAAPVTARVIARVSPQLGLAPSGAM